MPGKEGTTQLLGKGARAKGPTMSSTFASVALIAGAQALGILTAPGPKRVEFDSAFTNDALETKVTPYLAGTNNIVPNLIWFGDLATKKVKNDVAWTDIIEAAGLDGLAGYLAGGGHFGVGTPDPPTAYVGLVEGSLLGALTEELGRLRTASFRVYAGWAYDIGHGVIDAVTQVFVDERLVAVGTSINAGGSLLMDDPQAWGGDHVAGGVYALCDITTGDRWPIQQPNPYLRSQVHCPAFGGKAQFIIRGPSGFTESGYFGAVADGSPVVRPLRLTVLRIPNLLGVPTYKAINGGKDANPVEVIYDWMTGRTRGFGYGGKVPLEKIDLANFQAAAQVVYNEGLGYSAAFTDNIGTRDALEDMCEFTGCVIREDPDGFIRIKLIRRDYNIATLPVFDESNIESVEGYTPGTYRDVPNEIRLEFLDRDFNYKPRPIIAPNDAVQQLVGERIPKTINFLGIGCKQVAQIIAARELAASFPRPIIKLTVNSDADAVRFGDPIVWKWAKYRVGQKVLRVVGIKPSDTSSNKIELSCTEDVYGRGDTITAFPADTLWDDTTHLSFDVSDIRLPMLVLQGQGDLDGIHGEAGNEQLPMLVLSGAGSVIDNSELGEFNLPMLELEGAGIVFTGASGNFEIPMLAISGAGGVLVAGASSYSLPMLVMSGAGTSGNSFLLNEDGTYILQEDGSKIILE